MALAKAKDATNPEIDLSAYGIHRVLKRGFDINSFLLTDIQPCSFKKAGGDITEVTFSPGSAASRTYRTVEQLGKGTFGTAYAMRGSDGMEYAVKWMHGGIDTVPKLQAFIRECIIQIMVVLYTMDLSNGPYAPIFYEIGFDPLTRNGFIRSQRMTDRLDKLIHSRTAEQNETSVPSMLMHISNMLHALDGTFKFNHRDLKADNVMYYVTGGARYYRLIDFGMACLTWNGVRISGTYWFDSAHSCFKIDRDFGQFLYYLFKYQGPKMSARLNAWIAQMLLVRLHGVGSTCQMERTCGIPGWAGTYDFVDRASVEIPYAYISRVGVEATAYKAGKPFGTSLPAAVAPVPAPAAAAAPAVAVPAAIAALPDVIAGIAAADAPAIAKAVADVAHVLKKATAKGPKAAAKNATRKAKAEEKAKAKADALAKKLAAKAAKGVIPKVAEIRAVVAAAAEGAGKVPTKGEVAEAAKAIVDALKPPTKALAVAERVVVADPPACPEGMLYSAKTRKCVKARVRRAASVAEAPCPPGKVRNPVTRRCVKEGGEAAKKVAPPLPMPPAGVPLVAPAPIVPKACPDGKVYNPVSRRCVKAAGARGKKLGAVVAKKSAASTLPE